MGIHFHFIAKIFHQMLILQMRKDILKLHISSKSSCEEYMKNSFKPIANT